MVEMAAWGTMPKRKLIDGHWYEYHQTYYTNHDAKQVAREIRNKKTHTEKARIVIQSVNGYKRYHVYTRTLREGVGRRE